MKLTDSDDELYGQLVDTLYGMHPAKRVIANWVMNKNWRDRIKAMRHAGPGPMQFLLGKPVKVIDDGGAPHMEVPARAASEVRMNDAPKDPMGPGTTQAIIWHQVMTDYEAAGFTREEAFELTAGQAREYWSVAYETSTVAGIGSECPVCGDTYRDLPAHLRANFKGCSVP